MEIYRTAIAQAITLLTGGQVMSMAGPVLLWQVVTLSLRVSGTAIAISALIGLPIGYAIGMSRRFGRGALMMLVNTGMGFPLVVVGLIVYLALSNTGPLGRLNWLFTPQGIIIAQVVLATPMIVGVTAASVSAVPRDMRLQLRALGASRLQEGLAVFCEARSGVMAAVIAGLGAIISEVGAVSIVGGGIEGHTQVMTTAIMEYVRQGHYSLAMAWAIILIGISLTINALLTAFQNTNSRHDT